MSPARREHVTIGVSSQQSWSEETRTSSAETPPFFRAASINRARGRASPPAKNFDKSARPGRTRLAAGPLNMRHAAIQVHALSRRRLPTAICS
ncbi:hypothetical protein MRX96_009825 [Rhipicephalus microplus]